jgi:hypothetical protein
MLFSITFPYVRSLTTPLSTLSPACDNLVIYNVTALATLSFPISTSKLWRSGTSIVLQHLHHTSASPSFLVLTTVATMDIFGTTFIGFDKEFDYQKKKCKRNGTKDLSDYAQEEDMTPTKFPVMECEMMPMMPHVG